MLQIYHFHNGTGGGVLSVIKNLLQFSQNTQIQNHIIHAINKNAIANYNIEPIQGAVTQQLFYYTTANNFYYTAKQLAKLLPNKNAIIVAHDWVELGMVSNLGLQNPVIQFLHGDYDYYYQLATKNIKSINTLICVSYSLQQKLIKLLPNRVADIKYLRFPVPNALDKPNKNEANNIIFLGRPTKQKGYDIIIAIANELSKKNIIVQWHIVGVSNEVEFDNFNDNVDVSIYGNLPNEEVQKLLQKMNFIFLPSLAEGMPVSIIEAMKAGVVPLVNNIKGGVQELIENNITGFKIDNNNVNDYVICLQNLLSKSQFTNKIAINAAFKANQLFCPLNNTIAIEAEFLFKNENIKAPLKLYGSRLDHPLIPNCITKAIRQFKK